MRSADDGRGADVRGVPWFVAAFLVALAWPAGFGSEEPSEIQPASRSLRDGVYTQAQAARGKAVYLEQCVECHKEDLRGDGQMTPSLVGIGFTFRWKDKRLYDYFVGLRDTMPLSAPGSLGEPTYADLVAYMLSEVGYPSGNEELSAEVIGRKDIVIEAPAADAANSRLRPDSAR
ncbi:MAG: cytochrome c [Pseudomonadales bacterium]|nr:cytochrome c [Pseudomonadales bacterium]